MITLRLDSHMLSNFQSCLQMGYLGNIKHLRPKGQLSFGLSRGTHWHKMMEYRNLNLKKGRTWLQSKKAVDRYIRKNTPEDEVLFYMRRYMEYCKQWETDNYKVLGTEVGFSKILYKGKEIQFIYEGKIDLLLELEGGHRVFLDHKTQHPRFSGPRYDLCGLNNQFLGYSWATGIKHCMVDYVSWSQKVTERTFRRETHNYSRSQIQQWHGDTIDVFWTILKAIREQKYPLSRNSCDTKYGLCQFYKICERSSEVGKNTVIEMDFNKEVRWEPWK